MPRNVTWKVRPDVRPWIIPTSKKDFGFIHEIFTSIQGEGLFVGEPTTFIRLQYCPFDCNWCDSKRTWRKPKDSDKMHLPEVLASVNTKHICITGGEPLSQWTFVDSIIEHLTIGTKAALKYNFLPDKIISVETSGYLPLPPSFNDSVKKVASWVIDYKLPGSANQVAEKAVQFHEDNWKRLRPMDQLKFVVADEHDLEEVERVLRLRQPKCALLISPVNATKETGGIETATIDKYWHRTVIEFAIKFGLRYSPQIHKFVEVQ